MMIVIQFIWIKNQNNDHFRVSYIENWDNIYKKLSSRPLSVINHTLNIYLKYWLRIYRGEEYVFEYSGWIPDVLMVFLRILKSK